MLIKGETNVTVNLHPLVLQAECFAQHGKALLLASSPKRGAATTNVDRL